MNDDVSDIIARYNANPQDEQERLERHQLEHDLTWVYLEKYLPARGTILELGAATGRYTVELARRGYEVTAVDFAAELLAENKKRLESAGALSNVKYLVSDARDLSQLKDVCFDAILLMGPLYHLVELSDRKLAVKQASEHLKTNGILIASFISRFGILADIIKKDPDWINQAADVESIIERGRDLDDYPRGGFRGYFCDPGEIIPFFSEFDYEALTLAAVEPCIAADDLSYNNLDTEIRKKWLNLFFSISTHPALLGGSGFIVCRAKGKPLCQMRPPG
jgi:SAM-dependent methyltransferase